MSYIIHFMYFQKVFKPIILILKELYVGRIFKTMVYNDTENLQAPKFCTACAGGYSLIPSLSQCLQSPAILAQFGFYVLHV